MPDLNLGSLAITSSSFEPGGPIPDRHAASGADVPPQLQWSGVPDGTVELALVVHDPDAPLVDGFTHWVVHGIAPDTDGVGEDGFAEGTAVVGPNETGEAAYMGPAPPPDHGPHHYFFHLYALDQDLGDEPLTRAELLDRMEGHILEQARVVGTFRA
jgi:Raf kinase inhibitor-like YbhB/YbcL family protein